MTHENKITSKFAAASSAKAFRGGADAVADDAKVRFTSSVDRLGESAKAVSSTLHSTADNLREGSERTMDVVASSVSKAADAVRDTDLNALGRDAVAVARKILRFSWALPHLPVTHLHE